jgi:hypothetical protein
MGMWGFKSSDPPYRPFNNSDWRPTQDPTSLTNDAIKLLEEKLDVVIDGKVAELQTQIDAQTKSALKFEADLQRVPTAVTVEVSNLKELVVELINALESLMLEKFKNVDGGFEQRDKALIAALAAAKEIVNAQTVSADKAATKAETNFTELIKKQQDLFTVSDANTRERLTKLESISIGVQQAVVSQHTERATSQASSGLVIAIAAVAATVAASIITLIGILLSHSASVVTAAK